MPSEDILYHEQCEAVLKEFSERIRSGAQVNQSDELRLVIRQVARTGVTCYNWDNLRVYLVFLLENSLREKQAESPEERFEEQLEKLKHLFMQFTRGPPFTIQRLCELLISNNQHTTTRKYLFALEKILNVSSYLPSIDKDTYNQYVSELESANENTQPVESMEIE